MTEHTHKHTYINTIPLGIGKVSHLSYIFANVHVCSVASAMSDFLQPRGPQPARLLCPWGFSRQGYWSGLPHPPPGDLPDPVIKPVSFASKALKADS